MLYLVAQGPEAQQRWRRRLLGGQTVTIGRGTGGWKVDWDPQISRQHAILTLDQRRLRVKRIPESTNPLFFRGQQLPEFNLSPGDHFVIGQTRFLLVAENVHVTMDLPSPDAEQNFDAEKLRQGSYRDAGQKIAVLSQLPDVISKASNETDLHVQVVNILLTGIRRATTVGIVRSMPTTEPETTVGVLHWDQRLVTGGDFQPSGKLIRRAVQTGETVLHLWKTGGQFGEEYITVLKNGDWAFVSPLNREANTGLAIYVAGNYDMPIDSDSGGDPLDLHDDIKFTELVATTLANLHQVSNLQRKQASLRSFFSPVVLDAISQENPDQVLEPRECEVSVLFCDLRGFSMRSEQYADDLLELLDRVSGALGVTTREILSQRGVVGDFHGDATMGFWGWPLDQPDRASRACHAALRIQHEFLTFASLPEHPLHDFRIGLGIATGNAVAGRIGTEDQVKVTVFGPVVNVAARLESMTQKFRAGILVDERTDELIRTGTFDSGSLRPRIRRLAVVQPFGMNNAIKVSQILPPPGQPGSLDDEAIALYESGLDEFTQGNWETAFEIFHRVPADDQAKDFLTVFIAQHNRIAPPDWPGYISLQQK